MMTADIEGTADLILRMGRADQSEPLKPVALARSLLGPGALFSVHARSLPGDGSFALVNGHPRIYVRQGLSPERRRWAVCHELAEWWMWKEGVRDSRIENVANAIAAALLAPRPAFRRALREVGDEYHKLAEWFGATESCTALRLGEVTGQPLVLVTPQLVRVRGDEFVWPEESTLRVLAKKPRVPGLRKARLRDDRRRVAMRVG